MAFLFIEKEEDIYKEENKGNENMMKCLSYCRQGDQKMGVVCSKLISKVL